MLSSFRIINFRSILDVELDFSYGEGKAPNGYREWSVVPFFEAEGKERLVPVMAFFGANASGKTSLLRAMKALKELIVAGEEAMLAMSFEPNLLNQKCTDTTFEIKFFSGFRCYEYKVVYNAHEVVEEALTREGVQIYQICRSNPVFFSEIAKGTYMEGKLGEVVRVECTDGKDRQVRLFLNRIGRRFPGLDEDLRLCFEFFDKKLQVVENTETVILPMAVDVLAVAMGGDREGALNEITEVVRKLDVDLAKISINRKPLLKDADVPVGITQIAPSGERFALTITTLQRNAKGGMTEMDFQKHESSGTQRLAGLVGLVLFTLKVGGVLLVDELECSLHPLLVREIVLMFKSKRVNSERAQLIATTHETDLLDDAILRVSEIALVRKTVINGVMVRRLIDSKKEGEDIRNVTNFRKRYLEGYYAAIPYPSV